MKGRLVNMVKKWWVLVLVMTLAMSLTSCGSKKKTNLTSAQGWTECSGTLGDFFVIVEKSPGRAGFYDLYVEVVQAAQDGDFAAVSIYSGGGSPRVLDSQLGLYTGEENYVGSITEQQLYDYDEVLLTGVPTNATGPVALQSSSAFTSCDLPQLGDGSY